MSDQIIWRTPPENARGSRRSRYEELAAELRAHPGEWAVYAEEAWASQGTHLRKGRIKPFNPPSDFEVQTVTLPDKPDKCTVYVRYIGGDAA